ncbi:MAG: diguanylate cyclase domain-containing protein [Planktothrix sp.]
MILSPESSPKFNCLIIDSDDQNAEILSTILGEQGYSVTTALNVNLALEYLQIKNPDIIFWNCSEIEEQEFNLNYFYKYLQDNKHNIAIFFLISYSNNSYRIPVEQDWHCDYIRKPFYPPEIIIRLQNIEYYRQSHKILTQSLLQLEQETSARHLAESQLEKMTQKLQTTTDKLKYLSRLDPLTQLVHRPYFDEYLLREWQRLAREKIHLSLIIGDIDQFKGYNDFYGFDQGDICLQTIAQTLAACIKRPADLVGRYRGEKFAILLPHTPRTGAIEVAKLIRAKIQQLEIPHPKSELSPYLTMSLGVATAIPSPELPPYPLIAVAEEALQEAKQQGGDRIGVGVHWR